MPGVGKNAVIIDVAEAAGSIGQVPAQEVRPAIPTSPGPKGKPPDMCVLGHRNDIDAKFCASCGLPMGAQAPLPRPNPEDIRPKPWSQLTDEERAERDRQHAEALAASRAFEAQQLRYQPSQGESILIHFVDDGFTFAGQVWYRGQEIEIGPDHPRWEEVLGWITLDKYAQVDRYGKQFFDHGPWPGRRSYTDGAASFETLYSGRDAQGNLTGSYRGPGEQALRQADDEERKRGRAVPLPAFGLRG